MSHFTKRLAYIAPATLLLFAKVTAATNIPLNEEKAIQEHFSELAHDPGAVIFTPPQGWFLADPKALPPTVKVMVVGKGSSDYPPSINLSTEKFSGTLKQYLKIVKSLNESRGDEWKDLGTIRTEAGDASLSQVDTKSKWGTERLMHVILEKNGTVYILTAAALKNEFPKYYKEFFNSMRSLRINKDALEMVKDNTRRNALQKATNELKQAWAGYFQKYKQTSQTVPSKDLVESAFNSEGFQQQYWNPYKMMLTRDYADMGKTWQKQMLDKAQGDLFE